nr:MAG TPA: hypothetical protein [Caudoviricetes sp.]
MQKTAGCLFCVYCKWILFVVSHIIEKENINRIIYGSTCMEYLSIRQTAEKWEISIRRIQVLCNEEKEEFLEQLR